MTSNQEEEEGSGCGWIGIIVLLAFGALYQYNKANAPPPEELSETPVILQTPPFYGSENHGEAGTHFFLKFELTDYKELKLTGCRYSGTNDSITKLLSAGDTLVIGTQGHLTQSKDDNIYSIVSPRYGTLLNYTGITDCDRNQGQILTILGICSIVLGVWWLWERRPSALPSPDDEQETDPAWVDFLQQYQQALAGTITPSQFANNTRSISSAHRAKLNLLIGQEYDTKNYGGLNMLIIAARRSPSPAYTTNLCLIVDANIASITNENVVDLLCHLDDPISVPALTRAARIQWPLDEHMQLNKKCIRTLASIDTQESIQALEELTQDASPEISALARQELDRVDNT